MPRSGARHALCGRARGDRRRPRERALARSGAPTCGPTTTAAHRPASRSTSRWEPGARSPTRSRRSGRGDDWVWIGGVKGYMDGSLGSRTALFYQPYADDPKTVGRAAHARGFPAGLDRRRRFRRPPGGGPRHRRAGERPAARHLRQPRSGARAARPAVPGGARAAPAGRPTSAASARGGIIASMQPSHAIDDGSWADKRIGPERIKTQLRLPHPARPRGAPRLRLRLDRRADGSASWASTPR